MDRRRFLLTSLAGALARPLAVEAQQTARKIARIGMLLFGTTTSEMTGPEPQSPSVYALLQGLRALG